MDARSLRCWLLLPLLAAGLVWGGPVQAATLYFAHTDAQGSVVAVTDIQRNVVERREYEPFGLPRAPVADDPGYTGHVHDAGSDLVYMQQRYYDHEVGRFLSVDPVGVSNAGGNFNRYWYANNNPYTFVDPDGMQACDREDRRCQEERGNERSSEEEREQRRERNSRRSESARGFVVAVIQVADAFDGSVSFGVQAGMKAKIGVGSAGATLNLFAIELDLKSGETRVTQEVSGMLGAPVVGEGTVGLARDGPGQPEGPLRNISSYRGFSRNEDGEFVFTIGVAFFFGIQIQMNGSRLIEPFCGC